MPHHRGHLCPSPPCALFYLVLFVPPRVVHRVCSAAPSPFYSRRGSTGVWSRTIILKGPHAPHPGELRPNRIGSLFCRLSHGFQDSLPVTEKKDPNPPPCLCPVRRPFFTFTDPPPSLLVPRFSLPIRRGLATILTIAFLRLRR